MPTSKCRRAPLVQVVYFKTVQGGVKSSISGGFTRIRFSSKQYLDSAVEKVRALVPSEVNEAIKVGR